MSKLRKKLIEKVSEWEKSKKAIEAEDPISIVRKNGNIQTVAVLRECIADIDEILNDQANGCEIKE
jgi:molybdopterin converting factor small subunit